ncbi:hypothetical protein BDF20DRAFT_850341 [Mycotypha africana]|uniref:uncharacterized protein n=1 Tax=Mycotypha africana TaxID=64632 RepID=UPI0023000AF1|nr:uncharacterized protein BDF20DRAFT_850341 [Mycotypha africana]KAI8987448.1 hypothetical protein BDF20DRAFT_850341 [Mycotypha africana]
MTTEQRPTLSTYRPIAPSIALPALLPRPDLNNVEKRNWDKAFDDGEALSVGSNRRGSDNSDGISSTTTTNTHSIVDQRLRRKEQNRAAQRAFRERKERYVKELEDKIKEIEAAHATEIAALEEKISSMQACHASEIARLKAENAQLKLGMSERDKRNNSAESNMDAEPLTGYPVAEEEPRSSTASYTDVTTAATESSATARTQQQANTIASGDRDLLSSPTSSFNDASSLAPSTTVTDTPRSAAATSAIACIRDKDGVSFCEKLKEEVCSDAYNQLLTEPLFDARGVLNETVSNHPVPIVTEPESTADEDTEQQDKSDQFYEFEQFLQENLSPRKSSMSPTAIHLISCSEVWSRIAQDPMFDQYDTYYLYNELRKIAKCSRTGPVFEENEVRAVVRMVKEETQKKYRQQQPPTTSLQQD